MIVLGSFLDWNSIILVASFEVNMLLWAMENIWARSRKCLKVPHNIDRVIPGIYLSDGRLGELVKNLFPPLQIFWLSISLGHSQIFSAVILKRKDDKYDKMKQLLEYKMPVVAKCVNRSFRGKPVCMSIKFIFPMIIFFSNS